MPMIRLDKLLANLDLGSRQEVKKLIKKGRICVNDILADSAEMKIDVSKDVVSFDGQILSLEDKVYILLHKPKDYVCANHDPISKTVFELLGNDYRKDLFTVGRLDKDTEGLLLLTNDGSFSHKLLNPKKHVEKVYYLEIEHPLSKQDCELLEQGLDIGDEKLTLPAKVEVISDLQIHLSITEGRFHQVKRMLHAVNNEVLFLKRIRFGNLELDPDLELGAYRKLTQEEVSTLC